jgi:hypothetical protein
MLAAGADGARRHDAAVSGVLVDLPLSGAVRDQNRKNETGGGCDRGSGEAGEGGEDG